MGVRRLANLKKKWDASGSKDDEAEYLLEKIKCKQLTQEMLELAAHLGHPAACRALGKEAFTADKPDRYLRSLFAWGKPVFVLAAIAAARRVLPYWEDYFPARLEPRQAIESALTWMKSPCADHEYLAHLAANRATEISWTKQTSNGDTKAKLVPCTLAAAFCAASVIESPATSLAHVVISVNHAKDALDLNDPDASLSMVIRLALIEFALTGTSSALDDLPPLAQEVLEETE